jgi:hypothetical protein
VKANYVANTTPARVTAMYDNVAQAPFAEGFDVRGARKRLQKDSHEDHPNGAIQSKERVTGDLNGPLTTV